MGTAEMNASMTGANIDPATKDVVRLIFNENGNYLQDLVVDEAVRAADSLSRTIRNGYVESVGDVIASHRRLVLVIRYDFNPRFELAVPSLRFSGE